MGNVQAASRDAETTPRPARVLIVDDEEPIRTPPGESGSLTYTFEEAGELLVGCHEPGHYEAGMVAAVTVHP